MVTFSYSENGGSSKEENTTPENIAKHLYSLAKTKMLSRDVSPIYTMSMRGLGRDEFSRILESFMREMTRLAKDENLKAIALTDEDFSGREKTELVRLLQMPDGDSSVDEFTKKKVSANRIYFQLRKI